MDIFDRRSLKSAAVCALDGARGNPRRLVLLHSAITALALIAALLLTTLLNLKIDTAGGIAGLQTRTTLSSVSALVNGALELALPFWEMGYLFAAAAMYGGKQVGGRSLLGGFRRIGTVLCFYLLQALVYGVLAMVLYYPVSMLLMLTPLGAPILQKVSSAMLAGNAAALEQTLTFEQMLPFLIGFAVIYLLFAAPVFYRLRVAKFALADAPEKGAFAALRESFQRTRGRSLALFRLDLSFWWYYVLRVVTVAVCYGDVLLGLCGVTLPVSPTWSAPLFLTLGLAAQAALFYQYKNYYTLTYFAALDALRQAQPQPKPQKPVGKQPWG